MKSWTKPTYETVEKALSSVKKETDRQYFFSRLKNPLWVRPIAERGYFKNPPKVRHLKDGYVQYLNWPELTYLVNVAEEATDEIVDIVLGFSKTDNPRIYDDILRIALNLKGDDSVKLLPKIVEYIELDSQMFAYRYPELLLHWTNQSRIIEALEIAKMLIPFQEDPRSKEKQKLRRKNPNDFGSSLEPTPRFRQWDYQEILEKGIRPLAEREPYQVARILIDATASMIQLGIHQEDLDKGRDEDYSEIWCRRLDNLDLDRQDSKETLANTLTYACEQVFDKSPDSIEALDQALRKQRWKLFKRLRQHLYALHPDNQTLPWIREFILGYEDYAKWEYHYEFQFMIRNGIEHMGPRLLNEPEFEIIIEAILSGPSRDDFREWMGEHYSEEAFLQRQRYFHRKQLRPFAALLRVENRRYLDELETEIQEEPLSDEDYSPYGGVSGGVITYRSPKSVGELATLSDDELLAYINEWDDEHHDKDSWLIEINITALAGVFQPLFMESVVPDKGRLMFWMEHRENINRPVYVAAMANAMQELVKEQKFDKLDQWIEFCDWILSHPDTDRRDGEPEPSDESHDHPNWGNSRRAVVDFVDVCLNKNVNAPITARDGLAKLLHKLCIQFDWRLDRDRPVLLNRDDQITEAINNTRSRALASLISFGFWVRQHLHGDAVPEITDTLEKRLGVDAEVALTKPEHALLGMNFGNLLALNKDWALEKKNVLFPKVNITIWRDTFSSFLRFNHPARLTFDTLSDDYEFALNHLEEFDSRKDSGRELADTLGQHLFSYYLWEVYDLTGKDSLLERYYIKSNEDRQRWAYLFNHIGRSLRNSGKHLEPHLIKRVIDFFDWRFEAGEPIELQEFTYWLDAECLNPEWRLSAYSRILDFGRTKDVGLSIEMDALNKLQQEYLSQVVECFAKITDSVDQESNIYISAEDAKPLLKAGLNSVDSQIRENAERARENLLRIGRFDFLDMDNKGGE